MSGVFRPEQNVTVEATDDPVLAAAHGLTVWDAERGQFVAPAADASDAELDDDADQERYDHEHDELQQQGTEGLYPLSVLVGESGPEVAAPVTEGHEAE